MSSITQINNNVTIETHLKENMYDSLVMDMSKTGANGEKSMIGLCDKKAIHWWDLLSVYKDVHGIHEITESKDIIKWFQENIKGYNPVRDVTNRTPLFYIPCGPIVSAYINMPHQVNVQDLDGNTAMHYISKVGLSAFFNDIVDLNPNVNIKNNDGKYAMDLFLPGAFAYHNTMRVFKYLYKNTVYGASADIKKCVLNIVKHADVYYGHVDSFLTHSLIYLVCIIRSLSKEDIDENFPENRRKNTSKTSLQMSIQCLRSKRFVSIKLETLNSIFLVGTLLPFY